jgi:beta-glucosidase/6-phospho-beta-glucosidase/beta-galactosidase
MESLVQARYDMVYTTEAGMAVKKEAGDKEVLHDSKRVK